MTTITSGWHIVDVLDVLYLSSCGVRIELANPTPAEARVWAALKAGKRPPNAAATISGVQARLSLDSAGHADVLAGARAVLRAKMNGAKAADQEAKDGE